nr:hypothetical protein THEDDIDL_THEDDIDL_CDS_0006 [Microvirus sp.]
MLSPLSAVALLPPFWMVAPVCLSLSFNRGMGAILAPITSGSFSSAAIAALIA